ncbi:MAG: glycosyltransferase family 2 protein [Bdellovibrionaceae bacterium]|nr:glycosyltransferase family 2 protein [Pseudobdellovibrionaceae bacterium]
MTFSLVIPVFNEQETLEYSFDRLIKVLQGSFFAKYSRIEMILVNDGSRDKTPQLLEKLLRRSPVGPVHLKVLHFSRNFGHSNAVLAGLEAATGEEIGIIDADLQDPPELLPEMLAHLGEADVVYGQRLHREAESFFKRTSAWAFYRLLNFMTGIEIPKDTGDFRVITRDVLKAVLQCREQNPFLRGLVAWVGFRQKAFPYNRQARQFGVTKYTLKKMIRFAMQALLSFSLVPLRLSIYLGLFTMLGSVGLTAWAIFRHLSGGTVPGWTSMVVLFLFVQSITLLMIGVIGYYVGQIHLGVQGRPRYILRETAPRGGGNARV